MISYYWNIQILCEWRKLTNANIFYNMFLCIVTLHHTLLGVSGKPVFHASHLPRALHVKWHSISNGTLRPPYSYRKCFHICVQFHKFLFHSYNWCISVYLYVLLLCQANKLFWHSNPKQIPQWLFWVHFPRKDWSSRPLLISDITLIYRWPLTLLPAAFEQLPAFVISITSFVFLVREGHNYNWWCQMLYKNK